MAFLPLKPYSLPATAKLSVQIEDFRVTGVAVFHNPWIDINT